MAYVVTQSCCADASCVVACPVNCIHPAPGEPGFAEAEMVHIDPNGCVGCGACVTACPVGAIVPDRLLAPSQQPFLELNAAYYDTFPHADRTPVAKVPAQRRLTRPGPFRIAVIGAGPAGLYTADELLKHPEVETVEVFDRLGSPYGLVRYGVAPDHVSTKQAMDLFAQIDAQPRFNYRLGVEVGRDVTLEELREEYDAVVYAVGAAGARRLDIPGEELRGSIAATDLVGWYNDHPDQVDLDVPLDHERAVVIGNGNVALDIARILTADPDSLAGTAIAPHALAALRASAVREVVVLGRRGPGQAAFTVPELIGLAGLTGVDVTLDCDPALLGEDQRSRLLRELADRPIDPNGGRRRIVLRFATSPVELVTTVATTRSSSLSRRPEPDPAPGARTGGVRVDRNTLVTEPDGSVRAVPTGDRSELAAGLVIRAIGFRGAPVSGLPFDEATGTVPHDRGRVEPGVYVAGWIKRGPSGFIGTNKSCAQETVESILDDLDAGHARETVRRRLSAVGSIAGG
jgi:ferredoxin--NADP+ reductase